MLVENASAAKAAVAVSVNSGQFANNAQLPGLSHLLEHMLFLGCDAYPNANHLPDFVSQHGGQANAATGTERTHFYFSVAPEALTESAHQLFSMLHAPMFHLSRLEKEIHAIDAEFSLKKSDDLRRLYQVHKQTSNPEHPFSLFSVGNKDVFSRIPLAKLQQALINQFESAYVGDNIAVCVVAPHIDDACAQSIIQQLSQLPDKPRTKLPDAPLYLPEQKSIQINVKPLKQARRLILTFALPPYQKEYASKPLDVISHLLGDEGKNSLLHLLKQRGLITNLSAGGGISGYNFKDFNINLQLTEAGLTAIDDIVELVFAQIHLIRDEGLSRWRFEELKRLNQQIFDNQDQAKPVDTAQLIADNLHDVSPNHCMSCDFLLSEYQPDLFAQVINQFTVDNLRLKVIHPDVKTTQVADYYDTPFALMPLAMKRKQRWRQASAPDELSLPQANPFIVENLELFDTSEVKETPTRIRHQQGMAFWYAPEHQFHSPRGEVYLSFDLPFVMGGIGNHTLKKLWAGTMQDFLSEHYYHAAIAGLNINLYAHQAGVTLHTSGFSHKQWQLINEIMPRLFNQAIDGVRFERVKAKQLQMAHNSLMNKPINRLFTKLNVLVQRSAWPIQEMTEVLQQTTCEQLTLASEQFFRQFHLQAFMHGNWTPDQANHHAQWLEETIASHTLCSALPRDTLDLAPHQRLAVDAKSPQQDAAVVCYFQTQGNDEKSKALTIVTEQLLASRFFNQLRTQQQLGYVVGSGYYPINNHPGVVFYVQSPSHSARLIQQAIDNFLDDSCTIVSNLDETQFGKLKRMVARQLEEPALNIAMKAQQWWMGIANNDVAFDENQRIANAIHHLSLDDVIRFITDNLTSDADKGVVFYTQGKLDATPLPFEHITDIPAFKRLNEFTGSL